MSAVEKKRQPRRGRYLAVLKAIAAQPVSYEFFYELLNSLRYAAAIDPRDAETCALQNFARRLMSDLAEASPGFAKELHALACGWRDAACKSCGGVIDE